MLLQISKIRQVTSCIGAGWRIAVYVSPRVYLFILQTSSEAVIQVVDSAKQQELITTEVCFMKGISCFGFFVYSALIAIKLEAVQCDKIVPRPQL